MGKEFLNAYNECVAGGRLLVNRHNVYSHYLIDDVHEILSFYIYGVFYFLCV